MLTYLINVTDDLLMVFTIIGVIFAFSDSYMSEKGQRIVKISFILGLVIAAVRAYITNTRRLVGGWRVGAYGYGAALGIFVVFIIVYFIVSKRTFRDNTEKQTCSKAECFISIIIGLLLITYLFGTVSNVYVYPFKFDTKGNGLLSTDYLFRLGGYLLGIIISFASMIAAYKISVVIRKKGYGKLLKAAFIILNVIYAVFNFAKLMLVLTPRKIIDSTVLFNFAAASNNNSVIYVYLCFAMLVLMSVYIWIKSKTAKEPYSTKAEHRKQKSIWRTGKRFSILMLICLVNAVLCATLFVKLNTVVINEAPVEDPIIIKDGAGQDKDLEIPLTMVNDGHLHRFGYTTAEGYPTRLIVILKQENTTNYGVGLDACEICGEAGYYENNDGKVVCKKCGVVMNTSTIGMKGGCNPIIIDYDIDESAITIPVSEMVRTQSNFKK
ncbi:MAG: DUF2318 domain-containing protein [Lachnospiraceae bacterium]|nr:DUF2318 domain-containing protein [Lachnospiraceae bacterium]